MEAGNILSADVLDIIFDARNKEYGAYDLRKNYQRRLIKAMFTTSLVVLLLLITYLLVAAIKPTKPELIVAGDVTLKKIPPPDQPMPPPPPPPPPPKLPEPDFKMLKDAVPLIVKDDIPADEMPTQDNLDNAKIGLVNKEGSDDGGIVGPPVDAGKGIVEAPKKQDKDDGGFVPVEVESQYPGGIAAWGVYLNRNLNYPHDASDNQIQGTVMVQFIVDAEGNVSDVTALSGPAELRTSAIAAIKKSGKWTPALQNGRHVKSYKKQPVTFRLVE